MDYFPGVDVVVVNYKTPDDLRNFIRSFAQVQFEVPSSLYVMNVEVDDENEDVVEEEIEDIGVPVFTAGYPANVGYAVACNGAAYAAGELGARSTIAFFNADTLLTPGVLDHCHWLLSQNDDWGILGPKQVNEDGLVTHAGIFGTHSKPQLRGWKSSSPESFSDVRSDAISVSGSAYFVKRQCWDYLTECELFREMAPGAEGAFLPTQHYYEETYCSYHAHAHGWKVAYTGKVEMIHKWHQASPVGGVAEKVWMPESRRYFRRSCDHHNIPRD